MKQQSLFSNPHDLKTDVSKPDLLKDFISTKKPLVLKPVKRSRLDQIYLPENKGLIQTQIPLGRQFEYPEWVFPTIYRTEDKVREIISKSYESGRLGLDFEFDPSSNRISIIGVAVHNICAACRYTRNLGETLIRATKAGVVLVGHFVLGADKEVLEKDLDIETPLDSWDDSLILFYLLRSCLTKKPGKEESEGAAGFMGLGFASHIMTWLPNYKDCRGLGCQPVDYPANKIPCPKCLRGETLVWMADGSKRRINDLVSNKVQADVMCVDTAGNISKRPITGWFKNDRDNRQLVSVTPRYNSRGQSIVVTHDHEFLTENGFRVAKSLCSRDKVCLGTPDLRKNGNYGLILGILLGDSHINKKGKLFITHGKKQYSYLLEKAKFFSKIGFNIYERGDAFTADIKISPVLKYIEDQYRNNWRSFLESNFSLETLAVWYMDDGNYHRYMCSISVSSYTDDEIDFLIKLIYEKTGLKSYKKEWRNTSKNKTGKNIVFNSENAKLLATRISCFVPSVLRYKLHPNASVQNYDPSNFEPPTGLFFTEVQVKEVDPRKNWNNGNYVDNSVYCLEVADFHNFITYGGVVKNCDVFGYCAIDSWAGLMVADRAREEAVVKNIPPRVYEEHAELACNFCIAAEKRGFDVDWGHVKDLSSKMEEAKEKIFLNNDPFNPRSDKQVKEYFKARGVNLVDTQKETIEKELEKVISSYGIEDIEAWHSLNDEDKPDFVEDYEKELAKLQLYKTLGKGTKSWFDEKFVHADGKLHPRFIFTGTSTMRLSSSRPNMMNRAKHAAWAKEINKAFIPPTGYKWLSADAKNLEYRVALWLSGMDVTTIGWDAFQYILNSAGNIFDKPAAIIGQTPRQVAKTTSYLTLYFGGFRLLDEWELKTARIKRDIAKGILVVFPDWKYFDKIVAFTGIRLADKLFRNHKDESRKAALELQELYFDKLPLRNFHKLATKTAEKGFCQTPWGSYLELIEGLHDDPKVCSSKLGQGIGAEYVQGKQVQYLKNANNDAIMQLQVHDDITWAVPKEWSDEQCLDFARPLFEPSHRYPELSIPWEVAVGENNLGEMRVLNHGFI